jgi:glucose/arabinose dehydrogenase
VDPHFAQNRYLYFAYSLSADSNGVDQGTGDGGPRPAHVRHFPLREDMIGSGDSTKVGDAGPTYGRLTRYQMSATDSNRVDESTRHILIGATWATGFPGASTSHTVDDLHWGADGSLLVSAGEGDEFGITDAGGHDPDEFLPGRMDPEQDVGAFRALDLSSLGGKILRIDPATGCGLPSNPYYDGDPTSNRSRIWLYGLRNPFRFSVKPGTGSSNPSFAEPGTLYIGDVGWNKYEEIDVASAGGTEFGWPCYEAYLSSSQYENSAPTSHGCDTFDTPDNPAPALEPILSVHHFDPTLSNPPGTVGAAIIGGTFHRAVNYPAPYQNAYFFGDYKADWIKVASMDSLDQLVSVSDFGSATNRPVDFMIDPSSGDVIYLAIATGQVRRIHYNGSLPSPDTTVAALRLSAPWPNPSANAVSLALDLPAPARVEWRVEDLAGRTVWEVPARELGAGHTSLRWGGQSVSGASVHPGVYFMRVVVNRRVMTRRFALLR